MTATELYDSDFYQWALTNAELIRQGRLAEADLENIAEEIEAMGKSQKRELESRLAILLMHLLKWQYEPERRGRSWINTIVTQRMDTELLLRDNPSLRHNIAPLFGKTYESARKMFEKETGISKKRLPEECPYSFDQVMDNDFWPE